MIEELINELHRVTLFSKLDLRAGYDQVRRNPSDVYKTAFQTHSGQHKFNVMLYGLMNAQSLFNPYEWYISTLPEKIYVSIL